MTFLIAVPTGVKFFNWIGTIWRGQLTFEAPMLFILGFMVVFLIGGVTGVMLASPPMNFAVSDTYFVVAHFHYVLFGTVVFCMFGGFYFWWPKWTGKMLDDRLGKLHFWLVFFSFNATFLVQHWLGVMGMPRRVANYPGLPPSATTLNDISSIGSFVLGASTLVFFFQRVQDVAVRRARHRRRSVGFRELAGVGDLVPAAPAQLHLDPADQVRAARVRPAPPDAAAGGDRTPGRTAQEEAR